MGREIERKFLTVNDEWKQHARGRMYRQGYIRNNGQVTVRARIAGETGYLTLKGPTSGASRSEFEYRIPVGDAAEILDELCDKPLIEKRRYKITFEGMLWEIDEFSGENQGLVIAEIELQDEQQEFKRPSWLGKEVTGDKRYYNASLVKNPYQLWKHSE